MAKPNSGNTALLEVSDLSKHYGNIVAVKGVSFRVNKGDVIAFLGPNGAGKSTTIKMMSGYLRPTEGQVLLEGQNITKNLIKAKTLIGYMPESTPSYGEMTVEEYLSFIAESYELPSPSEAIARVIELTKLQSVQNQLIETLSKGYRSRVSFAAAIIHDPPILLLDEPTDGLDPNQKNEIRTLIKNLAAEKAVVVSTHILEEVSAMCNRVIVISEGKIVLDGSPRDLEEKADSKPRVVISIPREKQKEYESALATELKVAEQGPNGHDKFFVETGIPPEMILERINKAGLSMQELYLDRPNIDQAFRKITRTME